MATDITKAPTAKALYMSAPKRNSGGSRTVKCTYSIPSSATSSDNAARIEGFEFLWDVRCASYKNPKNTTIYHFRTKRPDATLRECHLDLTNFQSVEGPLITRNSFYPVTDWLVTSIICFIRTYNRKGYGPWVNMTTKWESPFAPTVTELTQDEETGVVSCTVTVPAGEDLHEVYNGQYQLYVYDSSGAAPGNTHNPAPVSVARGSSTTVSYDVSSRERLSYTDYIKVEVTAWSRGYLGDSSVTKRTLYVSWPNRPTIDGGRVTCPARGAAGKVTVPISLNRTTEHPVTGVRLQKLVGVTYESASQIPANAGWENCGVPDNGNCSALSAAVEDVLPEEGLRTWLRIKSWNQIEDLFSRYSDYVELSSLYKAAPTAEDDVCSITSATSSPDGRGAELVIGFGDDGNTGTEVSWSADEGAWESTAQPDTFEVTWRDQTSRATGWARSCGLSVRGLDEGTAYHFRARRYLDSDGTITRSAWSNPAVVTPAAAPGTVTLSAPASIEPGGDCDLSWTYDGGKQTSWRVLSGGRVVAQGSDQSGGCVVASDRVAEFASSSGIATLSVEVTTAGGSSESDAVEVTIASAPTLSVTGGTVTAQPAQITVTCSVAAELAVTVRSRGSSAGSPGQRDQVDGDVVWSDVLTPTWGGTAGARTATVQMPGSLDLRDGGVYRVSVTATDQATGLRSSEVTAELVVAWSRRAPMPVATVTPLDVTDLDGTRTISCTVALGTPVGYAAGDTCDVWRVTPDGERLCFEGAVPGQTVIDQWAPYGTNGAMTAYMVVLRTPDGDAAWAEFPYTLQARELRIDFDGQYVELPYNLSGSESREKDFEARRKLDGTVDGYWNAGAMRKASLSADVERLEDPDTARLLRELGQHAGPCLVRVPDGSCYMANVQVSTVSWSAKDAFVSVTLDATEVALTSDYMASLPPAEEEEEEE